MDYRNVVRVMANATVEASKKIIEIYSASYDVTIKDDDSPLTTADIESNRIIVDKLTEEYPEYSILSEEDPDSPARLTNPHGVFIVDPLDGTKEFVNRNGEFCVSIALAVDSKAVAGVIAVPVRNEVYYACGGFGAYKTDFDSVMNGFSFGVGKKLRVSERTSRLVVALSRSHGDEKTKRLIDVNRNRISQTITVGSCLKGCMIAEGLADVHYRFGAGTKEWDTAGMQIICEEAGATFTDIHGEPLPANRKDPHNRSGFIILNRPESALCTSGII